MTSVDDDGECFGACVLVLAATPHSYFRKCWGFDACAQKTPPKESKLTELGWECRKSFFRKLSSRRSSQKFKESLIRKDGFPYQCVVGLVFALTA
jgi:hypothetical protein